MAWNQFEACRLEVVCVGWTLVGRARSAVCVCYVRVFCASVSCVCCERARSHVSLYMCVYLCVYVCLCVDKRNTKPNREREREREHTNNHNTKNKHAWS